MIPKISIQCGNLTNYKFNSTEHEFKIDGLKIYLIDILSQIEKLPILYNLLSESEKMKSEKYRQEKDKVRYIIAKAYQRQIIAHYLNVETKLVEYYTNENLKPFIAGQQDLNFNVSHSGNMIALAFYSDIIGVDIEKVDPTFDIQPIIDATFSEEEKKQILISQNKHKQFYSLWTRKESFVKAISKGIDDTFKQVPSIDGTHFIEGNEIQSTCDWIIQSIELDNSYILSFAYKSFSNPIDIKLYNWPLNL